MKQLLVPRGCTVVGRTKNACETSSCTAVESRPGSKKAVSVQTLMLLVSSSEVVC